MSNRHPNYGILASIDCDAVLSEIAAGKLSKELADQYGVTARGLRKHLAKHPHYREAIQEQATSLVELAVDYSMKCDAEEVPIARARVDAAFKYAERRDPANWGQRTQLDVHVDFGGALQQIAERMSVVSEQQNASSIDDMRITDVMSNSADATLVTSDPSQEPTP